MGKSLRPADPLQNSNHNLGGGGVGGGSGGNTRANSGHTSPRGTPLGGAEDTIGALGPGTGAGGVGGAPGAQRGASQMGIVGSMHRKNRYHTLAPYILKHFLSVHP